MNLVRFLKDWTLPVAMAAGVSGYFLFAEAGALSPLRPAAGRAASALTPALVFAQLLLVFCKVRPSELRVRALHGWLLAVQLAACLGLAGALAWCPAGAVRHEVLEGAMVCFICPTATAAAVVTGKLGGSAATLTTYTLLSNLLAAVVVPLVFPWVEPHAGVSFWGAFLRILGKVFPLLICPFLLACALRRFAPGAHGWLVARGGAAFYLWGVALAIVSGQTAALLAGSAAPARVKWLLALAGLAACVVVYTAFVLLLESVDSGFTELPLDDLQHDSTATAWLLILMMYGVVTTYFSFRAFYHSPEESRHEVDD